MSHLKNGAAYIDGWIAPISEAKISILDWGFLHSDATYDVVHVGQGKFFRLDDHLNRFYSGMEKLHMSIPYDRDELRTILSNCVKASGLRDAYVEMITTRGQPQPGSRDPRTCSSKPSPVLPEALCRLPVWIISSLLLKKTLPDLSVSFSM